MSEDVGLREQHPIVPTFSGPIHFLSAIRENWYLTVNLVRRDLRAKYRRAVIGYGWTWLEPLLLAAVYYILFTIIAGTPDPLYPLHVLLGIIVWGHFSKSLQATLACLQKSRNLIKQVFFPREILATTPVLTQLWITVVSFISVLPIMLYLEVEFSAMIWMVPLGLLYDHPTRHGDRFDDGSTECNLGRYRTSIPLYRSGRILRFACHVDLRDVP